MNSTVEQKVAEMFENGGKICSLLLLQNNLEDLKYDYNDNRPQGTGEVDQDDLESYCFEHYKNNLPSECENMNLESFKAAMKRTQKSRYKSGVIAETNDKRLLAIISTYEIDGANQLDFPKGKEDYGDNEFKKATAFREFGEETGVWVSDEEYLNCKEFVDIRKSGKSVRYYLFDNLNEGLVDLKYKVKDEIEGLEWVTRHFDKSASKFATTNLFDCVLARLNLFAKQKYIAPSYKVQTENDPSIGLEEYKLAREKNKQKLAEKKLNEKA